MTKENDFLLSTMLYNYLEKDLGAYRINATIAVKRIMENKIDVNELHFLLSFIDWRNNEETKN